LADQRPGEGIATLGKLIVEQFSRIGFPVPRLADWITSGRHDEAKFVDAAHPTGGTRMAEDSHEGVVDANYQIHGVEGVFIAGSSVFPTGGHANPTQTIVALSIRLADRLKSQIFHDERGTAGGL
jgi:choline dehydrogenase-like flavoprotein